MKSVCAPDRTQQRTLEQISDIPVPQVVEELLEIKDQVQNFFLAVSPAKNISEKLQVCKSEPKHDV